MYPDDVGPSSNKFTIDLAGISLSDEDLAGIRKEAVKSAMLAASRVLGGKDNVFDSFGTFSTFSTFSTFGSAASSPIELPSGVSQDDKKIIERTLEGKGGGKRR